MADGVPLCVAPGSQLYPKIVTDGAGGAIIVWEDARNGIGNTDIYAQRIDAMGHVDWASGGLVLCSESSVQRAPKLVSDDSGGAIVVWNDVRPDDPNDELGDLYAQRVAGAGQVLWSSNGVSVCTHVTGQWEPSIVADGAGGAIVAWVDYFGISWEDSDIYAQRIGASGELQWAERGLPVSATPFENQGAAVIAPDGAGGAIVAWHDWGGNGIDIFAQRIDPAGNVQWTLNGIPVCSTPGEQLYPSISSDGVGGAIVAWNDGLTPNRDVRAGRINSSGVSLWGSAGALVSGAANEQQYPVIVSDGGGGAIVAWTDLRSKVTSSSDVYAQRVGPEGLIPTGVRGNPRTPALVVSSGTPNPFSATTLFNITLVEESNVDVRVYDVRGRLVRQAALGTMAAGVHPIAFDGRDGANQPLPSGVYFYRVTAGDASTVRKFVIAPYCDSSASPDLSSFAGESSPPLFVPTTGSAAAASGQIPISL
jgi:hypothetical protein